jgi:hypothetical protein
MFINWRIGPPILHDNLPRISVHSVMVCKSWFRSLVFHSRVRTYHWIPVRLTGFMFRDGEHFVRPATISREPVNTNPADRGSGKCRDPRHWGWSTSMSWKGQSNRLKRYSFRVTGPAWHPSHRGASLLAYNRSEQGLRGAFYKMEMERMHRNHAETSTKLVVFTIWKTQTLPLTTCPMEISDHHGTSWKSRSRNDFSGANHPICDCRMLTANLTWLQFRRWYWAAAFSRDCSLSSPLSQTNFHTNRIMTPYEDTR